MTRNLKTKDITHYGIQSKYSDLWNKTRSKIKDLYNSERYFFLPLLKKSSSFLDLGCATGGFYNIIRNKKNNFEYYGYDVSQNMIRAAKKKYNNGIFKVYDGNKIGHKKKSVDFCFSFGTLHHTENYLNLIDQMIKVSKRYIVFDLRFTKDKSLINNKKSYQSFFYTKKKYSRIQYNVINFENFINSIKPYSKKYAVKIYGYNHLPNKTVTTKYKKVITASVFIDKGKSEKIKIILKNKI